MSAGFLWVRLLLLSLAIFAVLVGAFELLQLSRGRRHVVPGYGLETELVHLLMNALMMLMMTPLWSGAVGLGGAGLLGLSAFILAIVPALRTLPPRGQRVVVVSAAVIHVAAALLMAWLLMRMTQAHSHAMAMGQTALARPWFDWLAAGFFLFDFASVLAVSVFPQAMPKQLRSDRARMSILPHIGMDVGMIAMLLML